jgi:Ca2+-binding RTX toxin-like protein
MATITGTNKDDRPLSGTADGDVFRSLLGNDLMLGHGGSDLFYGDAGNDTIDGGSQSWADLVTYRYVSSSVIVNLSKHRASGGGGNDTLYGIEQVNGSAYNDQIGGDQKQNWLYGMAGNDFLWGEGGDDSLSGMDGNDELLGGAGNDFLSGGNGNDYLEGGLGNDDLRGGSGTDTVDYSWARGPIYAYANSPLYGLDGTVTYQNRATGADGTDTLRNIENLTGSNHDDQLYGGNEANSLRGLDGDDYISGGSGSDMLLGGNGDDLLMSGRGSDRLYGGGGEDAFRFPDSISNGHDFIYDWTNFSDSIDFGEGGDRKRHVDLDTNDNGWVEDGDDNVDVASNGLTVHYSHGHVTFVNMKAISAVSFYESFTGIH